MTIEQLNALIAWVKEVAQFEAAEATNNSEDGWPFSNKGEIRVREAMIEAFGFEMHEFFGHAQEPGINAALFAEYDKQREAMRVAAKAEARKKKSVKRKAKP